MTDPDTVWPLELKLRSGGTSLCVSFDDGSAFDLPAEYLRVQSPSAEVRGHSRKERKIVGGKRRVAITAIESIGSYAVKLTFDDMHATGIYTWTYLHELGRDHAPKWQAYLDELEKNGMSRDRAGEMTAGDH